MIRVKVLYFLALVLCTVPAFGYGSYPCPDNETSCDPYGTAVVEASGSKSGPADWYGGKYYYCAAESRWGELCWDAVLNPETNRLECRQVSGEGKCGCQKTTSETIGLCEQKH